MFHGRRAVELAPQDPVSIYNLGVIHYDRLEIDQGDCPRSAARWCSIPPMMARISSWPRRCC